MSESKSTRGPRRRWHEQCWLLDATIRAESIDWDQPRSFQTIRPIGAEAAAEVNLLKTRVRKHEDIAPVFAAASERHERMAKEAESRGYLVTAREEYYWMTQVAATQPRLKGVATVLCCHEPGCYTAASEARRLTRMSWADDKLMRTGTEKHIR